MDMKYTVITQPDENWEYRCNDCGQLRFYYSNPHATKVLLYAALYGAKDVPSEDVPTKCGACGSTSITVGRPGTLEV